jgi:TRAP-type mannitol/chloroaromatic compound transport system permease large subunit
METFPSSVLGLIEEICLLFFTLMLFVGIAGGRADMVLKPLLDMIGQLFGALLSVLAMLLVLMIKLLGTLIVAGIQQAAAAAQTRSRTAKSAGTRNSSSNTQSQ